MYYFCIYTDFSHVVVFISQIFFSAWFLSKIKTKKNCENFNFTQKMFSYQVEFKSVVMFIETKTCPHSYNVCANNGQRRD